MNGDQLLLDTNAILYLLNGDTAILESIRDKQIIVSVITEIELLSSKELKDKEEKQINTFLKQCLIVDITHQVKKYTIQLRKKYAFKLPDSIIAATALSFDIPLVTADRMFKKMSELQLILHQPKV
jgi:predicted nucleic acid-binding protein